MESTLNKSSAQEVIGLYAELFDFAPVAYFTLSRTGTVIDLNFAVSQMLGEERTPIKNTPFNRFVSGDTQIVFEQFLEQVFNSRNREQCNLVLAPRSSATDGLPIHVQLTGIIRENGEQCMVTMIDVTTSKQEKQKEYDNTEALINSNTDLMWSVDKAYNLIACNNAFIKSMNAHGGWVVKPGDNLLTQAHFEESYLEFWKALYNRGLAGETVLIEVLSPATQITPVRCFEISFYPIFMGLGITGVNCFGRDISKRKEVETALKESEGKYRTLVEQAVDAIVLYNAAGKILDANTGSVNFIGYEKEELMEMHVYDILTKEESTTKPINYEVLQKGESTVIQRMMRRKDGSSLLTEVRSQQLPDGRFLSVIRDLTERVKAQEQIQKEKELSDSIINGLPGIFYLYDEDGKFIRWNTNLENVTGYTFDEISRMNPAQFFDSDQQVSIRKRIKEALKKEILGIEVEVLTKQKNKIPFYINSITIDYEGKKCLMCIGFDITERKQVEAALLKSEEKYRTIFDNVQDVFYQTDLDGIIMEISPSIKYFSDFSRDEIIGTSFYNYYYNPDDRVVLLSTIMTNGEVRDYEIKIKTKTKTDEILYASINSRLVFDEEGRPNHITGAIRDITERKKNELEIAIQNKQLEIQNKELEQFTYITSHDLQEPLRNLISIAGLLKEEFAGKLDDHADQYLQYIMQSSGRMQELVKALSAYSRIGKEKLLVDIDCNQIVQEVLSDMSIAIKDSNAQITVQDLPLVKGYSVETRQLFQNLISNALKFRKKDSAPEIRVSVRKQKDHWLFSIQDNGIGIQEKDKEKIFVIFKRLHNRNEYEGTGIGLSHCKKIVELHGGNIWVDSKPGEGSIFNFTMLNL